MATRQSRDDLLQHYQDQLRFLESSADTFDSGHTGEAKRLAHTIRVLVHDTKNNSHSLLSQLDMKGRLFCNSAFPIDKTSLVASASLVSISVGGPEGIKHVAGLDGDDPSRFTWIDFNAWWTAPVIRDMNGHELSRKQLVLAVANKDGGSHVDPQLDDWYARLSRANSLGRFASRAGRTIPLSDAAPVAIRQIAHEVLKTLKPGYIKKPVSPDAAIIGDVSVHFTPSNHKQGEN